MLFCYILAFSAACGLWLAAWFVRFKKKRIKKILCAAGIMTACFVGLAVKDYHIVQERAAELKQTLSSEEYSSISDAPSEYQSDVIQYEQSVLRSYQWDEVSSDIRTEKNMAAASGIFCNVRLSKLYRDALNLSPDTDEFRSLHNNLYSHRGTSYNLSGYCLHSEEIDNERMRQSFLQDHQQYTLQAIVCAWEEGASPGYIVIIPAEAGELDRLVPKDNSYFSCSATFIGTWENENQTLLVFMHN